MVCGSEAAAVKFAMVKGRPADAIAAGSGSETTRKLATTGGNVGAAGWSLLCWPTWQCAWHRFGVSISAAAMEAMCSQSAGIAAVETGSAVGVIVPANAGQA